MPAIRRPPPFSLLPCVMLALAVASTAPAQETRALTPPPAHAIDQWTTEDGLPQNSVNAIAEAPDGHLWLGTFGGLVRFDGSRFTAMERVDGTGRHADRVLALAGAPDGSLWIGTEDDGLLRLKDGEYEVYTTGDGLPDDEVTALHLAPDGALWIGTAQGGVARLAEGRFTQFRQVDGVPIGRVVSFAQEAGGTLWINAGGRFFIMAEGTVSAVSGPAASVPGVQYMLLEDDAGARWLALSERMARLLGDSVRVFDVPDGSAMIEDSRAGYWIGTGNDGLFYLRPDAPGGPAVQRYALPDGQEAFRVRSMEVDRAGNVWIGTNANGLLRAKRNLFSTYTSDNGLSHDVATAVYQDAGGTVWVATNCGGVNAIDPRGKVRVFNPRSPGDPEGDPCVFALGEMPAGTMWQGSYGGGVSLLAADSGAPPSRIAGLPDSVVLALYGDRDGVLWVGTNSGGIAAVENGRVRAVYTAADGLAHNSVRTIRQTRNGDLWVGTLEGLSRLRDGRVTTYTAADGLSAGHVRAVHEDEAGQLWIGTYGGGLNRFADGEFTTIGREDGLADDVVSSIVEDDAGFFWMSGNRGIYRVALDQLNAVADGEIPRVHSVLYGTEDGLRKAETNGGFQPSAWKDTRGRLWFPTVEGVAVVDPADVVVDERPPTVVIEAVVVDGVVRPAGDAVAVGPGRPNLEIRYSGLSLSTPEHITFQYRLEGFDDAWVDAGTRRAAYYPRLQPGRYRFVVRAANRDGVWSDARTPLPIHVATPFWSTWWFRLAGAMAAVAALGAVIRRRGAMARRQREAREEFSRRLIEAQEQERRRIAGALHDGLGQQLLVIRNRALLALRSDPLGASARKQIRQITDVASESLADVRGVAHALTPRELDHLGLSAALKTMVESVGDTTEIVIRDEIQDVDGVLPVAAEINLYRIVQEALSNLVRHSGAGHASVRVRRDDHAIRVSVEDDGRGLAAGQVVAGDPGGGFGLSGMAERARILDGQFEVESEPGGGTRVRVVVPVAPDPETRRRSQPNEGRGA